MEDSFTAFVIDQLQDLGGVRARRLFGGQGLYWQEQIFGLIHDGRLFFRVSPATAPAYEEKGSQPFEPAPGYLMKGYYEVPATVLEDADLAVTWAREAWSLPRARPRKGKAGQDPKRSGKRPARPTKRR